MALIIELVETKPSSFEEEIEKPIWVDAMVEEYESIMKNNVWEVVPRLIDKQVVGLRLNFKAKHAINRSIEKYKSILVAKGFSHVKVIEYEETFALVVRYSSIRSILAPAT